MSYELLPIEWVKSYCQLAWVTQQPPVHHPKNPVLGFHGWDETVPQGSVYMVGILFFPSGPFFFSPNFYSIAQFFFWGTVFYSTFFWAHPWIKVFFWEAPTYRPSSYQSTSLHHAANCCPPHHMHSLPTPTVLFSPLPWPNKWASSSLAQEELRSLRGGQEELRSFNVVPKDQLLPSPLLFLFWRRQQQCCYHLLPLFLFLANRTI